MALRPVADLIARLRLTPEGDRSAMIESLVRSPAPRVLGFVNAHAVNICAANISRISLTLAIRSKFS